MKPPAPPGGHSPGLPPRTGWSLKSIMLESQFNNKLRQFHWNNTLMYVIYHLFNPLILYDGDQVRRQLKVKLNNYMYFWFLFRVKVILL